MSKPFSIITAATVDGGIGKANNLPWRLKKEMAYFTKVTMQTSKQDLKNAVIMGRKNWDSIPLKYRPLKNRINYVISRSEKKISDEPYIQVKSLQDALDDASSRLDVDKVFVIGGSQIYSLAIQHPKCKYILYTKILTHYECDVFFPSINEKLFKQASHAELEEITGIHVPEGIQEENNTQYEFKLFTQRS